MIIPLAYFKASEMLICLLTLLFPNGTLALSLPYDLKGVNFVIHILRIVPGSQQREKLEERRKLICKATSFQLVGHRFKINMVKYFSHGA